jgi:hypothetical protein
MRSTFLGAPQFEKNTEAVNKEAKTKFFIIIMVNCCGFYKLSSKINIPYHEFNKT